MTNRRTVLKTILGAGSLAATGISLPSLAAADELESLKDKGVIRIAMSGAYPPFNFINEENQVVGFDPAIGEEIAKRMGLKTEIITTAWDGIIGGLLANKYDAIVGSMSITPERAKVVDFVGPYYRMRRGIFVAKDSKITSLDDLKTATVGVTLGETHEQWARDQGYNVRTYKGLPELMLELENNRVDAIVNDDIPVLLAIKKKDSGIKQLKVDLGGTADQAGIAIRQGNPELHKAMQDALDAMMADGTYEKIAMKWIGSDIR
ncbi:amino acid ABC transporter substrate-binding protein, PAAT family [Thioclava sp. ES.031]|uniref:transporter substrate-binding domain-containing protein n=1 Tax=Thioclava sp. ES.031 TaxID=1798203 RepID=UPI000BF7701C|nr:transporter substrate-binding domain-containing protein [Thioclava sp. ES.031]PFG64640.1 amino acid ABC transporter substrate-binding protein, PAAT family [Thioclava sp. ES.031]